MSLLLTSCFGKIEDTTDNDNTDTVIEDTTNDDSNTDDTTVVVDDNGDTDDTSIKVDDNTTWNETNTDNITETNSADEQILEDEVNALLDEFIDSLDNYDK